MGQFAQAASLVTSPLPPDSSQLPPAITRSALPSIVGRVLSLALAVVVGWLAVDRGMAMWVQHEDAIVGRMARYVPQPDPEQLQALLTLGEQGAPMAVVLACDPAQPRCRRQLATLVQWQHQPSKFLRDPVDPGSNSKGEGMRRLVFLTRPEDPATTAVALTIHAMDAQGLLWGAIPALAQDPTTWQAASLSKTLHGLSFDPKQLARDRDDPETLLAVQIERTMAEALEVPHDSGLLVAGLPIAATQSEGAALLAAIDAAEAQLAENLKFFGGDVSLAQARGLARMPVRTRDRFVRWILIGKKVSSLPGAHSDEPQADGDDSDGEDDGKP